MYSGCLRRHPIDLQYDTDTSGLVEAMVPQHDEQQVRELNPYMGSQPSIIRRALDTLGDIEGYTFVDVGCGKGRPLVVASEYPFAEAVGFDISSELVEIANLNAARIARRFPARPPIRAFNADVANVTALSGKIVLFMFNPFGPDLMATLLRNLEVGLTDGAIQHLFIVYDIPVCGGLFDDSTYLRRWFAATLPYDPHELGFGPETEDGVVIWQSVRGARPDVYPTRSRRITTKGRYSAVVE